MIIVPPLGFAGFNQLPAASQQKLRQGMGARANGNGKRKRRASAKNGNGNGKKKRRNGKLKFGSPAWQKKYGIGKYAKGRRRK